MLQAVAVKLFTGIAAAILTDKFLVNAIVLTLEAVAKKTKNQYDDQLVKALKEALDHNKARSTNLYQEVKKKI